MPTGRPRQFDVTLTDTERRALSATAHSGTLPYSHVRRAQIILRSADGESNTEINHAYGRGPITGGFFPTVPPAGDFDLDHDQRLSITANGYYAVQRFFASITGIYGSGLTNGRSAATCGCRYGTGLFDFNPGTKVTPSAILNLSTGYTFVVRGGTVVTPQLYVENVFDTTYLLKGAFFSGASVGRPRSVQLRLNVGF